MKHIDCSAGVFTTIGRLVALLYPYLELLPKVNGDRVWGGCPGDGGQNTLWFIYHFVNNEELSQILEIFKEDQLKYYPVETLNAFTRWIESNVMLDINKPELVEFINNFKQQTAN